MMSIGTTAIISIISHLIFIYITWRVLLKVNFEPVIRKGHTTEGKILLLFLAIVIGTGVSRFFLEILQWSRDLIYLF
jgi:uncharacterized integral membrane protein (TIGR02327 family)